MAPQLGLNITPSEYVTVSQMHKIHASNALTRPRLRALLREQQLAPQLGFNIPPPGICDSLANPHNPHAFKALTRPRLRAFLTEQQLASQVGLTSTPPQNMRLSRKSALSICFRCLNAHAICLPAFTPSRLHAIHAFMPPRHHAITPPRLHAITNEEVGGSGVSL